MKCVLFLLLTFLCLCCVLGQEDADASATPAETLNFSKMRIKQLKKFLKDRGLECKGCAEKSDFVKMATENEDTPVVEVKKPFYGEPKSEGGGFGGDSNIDELMAQMKKMGMNGNVFTKDDMEKMNKDGKGYEDMFNKNGGTAGGQGYKPPKRTKKAKSYDAPSSTDRGNNKKAEEEAKEQGSETIELQTTVGRSFFKRGMMTVIE